MQPRAHAAARRSARANAWVLQARPDYPLRLSEMLRFGIMHDRTVYPVDPADGDGDDAPSFPDEAGDRGEAAPASAPGTSAVNVPVAPQ